MSQAVDLVCAVVKDKVLTLEPFNPQCLLKGHSLNNLRFRYREDRWKKKIRRMPIQKQHTVPKK